MVRFARLFHPFVNEQAQDVALPVSEYTLVGPDGQIVTTGDRQGEKGLKTRDEPHGPTVNASRGEGSN